jgi:hypothetical protein
MISADSSAVQPRSVVGRTFPSRTRIPESRLRARSIGKPVESAPGHVCHVEPECIRDNHGEHRRLRCRETVTWRWERETGRGTFAVTQCGRCATSDWDFFCLELSRRVGPFKHSATVLMMLVSWQPGQGRGKGAASWRHIPASLIWLTLESWGLTLLRHEADDSAMVPC